MKNTVLIKFVNRKIDRELTSITTYGDLIAIIDKIENIATSSKTLKPGSARYLQEICINKKRTMRELWKNKAFFHLTTEKLYKLCLLKERFAFHGEFDIYDSPQALIGYKVNEEVERF